MTSPELPEVTSIELPSEPDPAHRVWRYLRNTIAAGGLALVAVVGISTVSACRDGLEGYDTPARVSAPLHPLDYEPGLNELKIGNWNINQGHDADKNPNLPKIIEQATESDDDILALTEVLESQAHQIALHFPDSYVVYAPAGWDTDFQLGIPHLDPFDAHSSSFVKDHGQASGNMLIVKGNLVPGKVIAHSYFLSRPSMDYAQKIITEITFGNYQIFLTHIDWHLHAGPKEATEAAQIIKGRLDKDKLVYVLGDFNSEIGEGNVKIITDAVPLQPVDCHKPSLVYYPEQIDQLLYLPGSTKFSNDGTAITCTVESGKNSDHKKEEFKTFPITRGLEIPFELARN